MPLRGVRLPHASRTTTAVQKKLQALDRNNDGTLDEDELVRGIEELVRETRIRKAFMMMAICLFIAVLLLVGAIGGITYGIIQATKETKGSGAVMLPADGSTHVVEMASFDMTVVNGVLVSRQAASASNGSVTAPANVSAAVLRSAPYTTQQAFSSVVDIKALMDMKYFYVRNARAELALMVLGVGRVEQSGSVHGSVVKILTVAGTIIIDDVMISFEDQIAPLFRQAGFVSDGAGRRLLGVYDIFGFFSFIEDLEVFNLPPNEPKPSLPASDFQMVLKVWEPCMITLNGSAIDRCRQAISRPMTYNDTGASSGRSLLSDAGNDTLVVPGMETLEDGLDYVSSVNTVTKVGTLTRTVYEFAAFPDMLKVEVMDERYKNISMWQTYKQPTDTELPARPTSGYWCQNYALPATFFDNLGPARNVSNINFTFVGYATEMGTPARQFQLTIPQPDKDDGTPGGVLVVDYYDRADNKYPLFFDFSHPVAGHMLMYVTSFALLDDATTPSRESMLPPLASACSNPDSVQRMGSAFTQPQYDLPGMDSGPIPGNGTGTASQGRRFLLADDDEEASGLVRHTGPSGGPAYLYDPDYDPERPWQSEVYNRSTHMRGRSTAASCPDETSLFTLPVSVCSVWMNLVSPQGVHVGAECSGAIPQLPFIILKGTADINTCTGQINGCVTVSIGLGAMPASQYQTQQMQVLMENFGFKDLVLDQLKICAGYNWQDRIAYLKGVYSGPPLYKYLVKADLFAEIKFSSCCVWVTNIGLEVFVGIEFGFWAGYVSLGTVNFISNWYWLGSPAQMVATANPTITNTAGQVTPTSGFWGDWYGTSFCYSETIPGQAKGTPVRGVQVRMEAKVLLDNTALNSVRFACSDGSSITSHEGFWGSWTSFYNCPDNQFITGAQVRLQSQQGTWGDDTAINGIRFQCSNGATLSPAEGFWGDWQAMTKCPDKTFVCGMKLRVENAHGSIADDTALNGITLYCCNT